MEVLNGQWCAETAMIVGLVKAQTANVSTRRPNHFRNEQVQLCERDDAKVNLCSPADLDLLNPVDQGMFDEECFTTQHVCV